MIQRYISKISGPLMDRIDIHIDVPAVNYKEMLRRRTTAFTRAVIVKAAGLRVMLDQCSGGVGADQGTGASGTPDTAATVR